MSHHFRLSHNQKKVDKEMASPATAGYKYMFITEPYDDLKCLICHEVARDPKQHVNCGKLFCEKCLNKYGIRKPCPYCRMEQPLYFKDNRSELRIPVILGIITTTNIILGRREIRELPVKCDSMERGCQWVGTVGTLEEHMGVCQFTLVPCPKKCKDDNGIQERSTTAPHGEMPKQRLLV